MRRSKQTKSYNSVLLELLADKPIAFVPSLARLVKSATAGLFMSQLLYWWGSGAKPGWIYKTIAEFQKETCLSRSEQATAIKKWKALGVLEVKLMSIPPKRHFKIHYEKLVELLRVNTNLQNPANQFAQTRNTYGEYRQNTTESTAEITSKNNTKNSEKTNGLQTFYKAKTELAKKLGM